MSRRGQAFLASEIVLSCVFFPGLSSLVFFYFFYFFLFLLICMFNIGCASMVCVLLHLCVLSIKLVLQFAHGDQTAAEDPSKKCGAQTLKSGSTSRWKVYFS